MISIRNNFIKKQKQSVTNDHMQLRAEERRENIMKSSFHSYVLKPVRGRISWLSSFVYKKLHLN